MSDEQSKDGNPKTTKANQENPFCEETRQQTGPLETLNLEEDPTTTPAAAKKRRATPPPIPKR